MQASGSGEERVYTLYKDANANMALFVIFMIHRIFTEIIYTHGKLIPYIFDMFFA